MSQIDDLRKRHKQEIAALQASCEHWGSGWMCEEWAPAHSTGREVLVCDNCEKVLQYRPARVPR